MSSIHIHVHCKHSPGQFHIVDIESNGGNDTAMGHCNTVRREGERGKGREGREREQGKESTQCIHNHCPLTGLLCS